MINSPFVIRVFRTSHSLFLPLNHFIKGEYLKKELLHGSWKIIRTLKNMFCKVLKV